MTNALFRTASALGLCFFLALIAPRCAAAILYVSPLGSDDNSGSIASPYKTIQAAVNNASSGDTIALAYAIYQGNGNRDIDFAGKSLSIISRGGPGKAIIDCQGTQQEVHRAFYLHSKEANVVFDGLTIKNSTDNGAIKIDHSCSVKLNKCAFRDNTGCAIVNAGTLTLGDCTFLSNPSSGLGNAGTATLTGCTFSDNTDSGDSVSNYIGCTVTLINCIFTGNTTSNISDGSGGVYNGGTATLIGCKFTGNTSNGIGSGGVDNGISATITLTGCAFIDNTSKGNGSGGFCNRGVTATLTDCIFTGNTSNGGGGGFCNGGRATLTNCVVSGNTTTHGNGEEYLIMALLSSVLAAFQ